MKKTHIGWCILLATLTAIALLFLFYPHAVADTEKEKIIIEPPVIAPKIPQVLLDIAYAESHNDQEKIGLNYRYKTITNEDGTTQKVKYLWSRDIGKWQINNFYNEKHCSDAGFDIYTEEGNAGCAVLLYTESGTQPWNASKYCWSDIVACRAKRGGAYK